MTRPDPSPDPASSSREAADASLARGMADAVWVRRGTPLLVYGLGVAGAVPMLAISTALVAIPPNMAPPWLGLALLSYGAVVLSFIGAVHWGIALATGRASPRAREWARWRLWLGVVPSLLGWAAMLAGIFFGACCGLVVLMAGLGLTTIGEAMAARRHALPSGYMAMRWLLTTVVEACLLAASLSRVF